MSWYSDGEPFDEYDPPYCERCRRTDVSYEVCNRCVRMHNEEDEEEEEDGDEEMAKTMMFFPETVEEFMEQHKMVDTEQIYSNGIEYVPIFRMEQWFAHQADIPRWIPVTAGLPEEDYETGNGVQFSADVLATIVNHKNDGELYVWLLKTVDGKWYDYVPKEDGSQDVPDWCEVIAWMPLPTPYKGGEEE